MLILKKILFVWCLVFYLVINSVWFIYFLMFSNDYQRNKKGLSIYTFHAKLVLEENGRKGSLYTKGGSKRKIKCISEWLYQWETWTAVTINVDCKHPTSIYIAQPKRNRSGYVPLKDYPSLNIRIAIWEKEWVRKWNRTIVYMGDSIIGKTLDV